jgi:hypothetical protein
MVIKNLYIKTVQQVEVYLVPVVADGYHKASLPIQVLYLMLKRKGHKLLGSHYILQKDGWKYMD